AGVDPGFFQRGGCKYESKIFTIWNPGSRRFKAQFPESHFIITLNSAVLRDFGSSGPGLAVEGLHYRTFYRDNLVFLRFQYFVVHLVALRRPHFHAYVASLYDTVKGMLVCLLFIGGHFLPKAGDQMFYLFIAKVHKEQGILLFVHWKLA
ncbi:unnamed protein product, partial [Porites evermanni]